MTGPTLTRFATPEQIAFPDGQIRAVESRFARFRADNHKSRDGIMNAN
jgi:hypothetical protein